MIGVLVAVWVTGGLAIQNADSLASGVVVNGLTLNNFFSDSATAYQLMPPRALADGPILEILWSPDSSRIAYIQRTPLKLGQLDSEGKAMPSQVTLNAVDVASKRVVRVCAWDLKLQVRDKLAWLSDSRALFSRLYSRAVESTYTGYVCDLNSGTTTTIQSPRDASQIKNAKTPTLLALSRTASGESQAGLMDARGKVTPLGVLPGLDGKGFEFYDVPLADKTGRYVFWPNGVGRQTGDPAKTWGHLIDLSSGQVQVAGFDLGKSIFASETQVRKLSATGRETSEKGIFKWQIGCEKPGAITHATITIDSEELFISPDEKRVAYVMGNNLVVREIVKVPLSELLKLKTDAQKREAILAAEAVAKAFSIYVADYDEGFPKPDSDWKRKVGECIKDKSLLDRFQYTFRGGSSDGIADPEKTEIGYVVGPGGRAVVYADSSVRWKKD